MLIHPDDPRYPTPVSMEARAAGATWWGQVSRPGEKMIDVARRLGVTSAEVSAIKHGEKPVPVDGPLALNEALKGDMGSLDMCPRCGSTDITGPTGTRRKTGLRSPKYQRQMQFNCRGCHHVYQFDVHGQSHEARVSEAFARWRDARPARMKPTKRLAKQEQRDG